LRKLEAAPGFEPGIKVLQTSALPLGYAALEVTIYYIMLFKIFETYLAIERQEVKPGESIPDRWMQQGNFLSFSITKS
jgi:hypothetical protein